MADVVHADDQVLGRSVAVKIFRHGEPNTAQRIDSEIRTLASLSHPGLVTLYDAGTAADSTGSVVPYLVMELVDGPTLGAHRQGLPMRAAHVARIGHQIADALSYIHHRGVVHRDIKPANILIAQDPDVDAGQCAKLADFGIARIVDAERLTDHGTTVGTAHYLSPEQATGTSAGPPTDIYTLGLVLIECLTGTMVFQGSAVAAAVARLHRDPAVPEGLGPEWHSLLTEMTSRSPENRPDAPTVAHRLAELARRARCHPETAVLPVESTNMAVTEHVPVSPTTQSPRGRWVVPIAAALFVALGAAIVWIASDTGDGSVPAPESPTPTLVESTPVAPTSAAPPTTAAPAPAPAVPAFSNPAEPTPLATTNPAVEQAPPAGGNGNQGNGNGNSGNGKSNGNGNGGNGNGNSGRGN